MSSTPQASGEAIWDRIVAETFGAPPFWMVCGGYDCAQAVRNNGWELWWLFAAFCCFYLAWNRIRPLGPDGKFLPPRTPHNGGKPNG